MHKVTACYRLLPLLSSCTNAMIAALTFRNVPCTACYHCNAFCSGSARCQSPLFMSFILLFFAWRPSSHSSFRVGPGIARAHWTWITPAVDAWDKLAVHAKITFTMCIDVPLTRLLVLATCKLRDRFADEFHLPAPPPQFILAASQSCDLDACPLAAHGIRNWPPTPCEPCTQQAFCVEPWACRRPRPSCFRSLPPVVALHTARAL